MSDSLTFDKRAERLRGAENDVVSARKWGPCCNKRLL